MIGMKPKLCPICCAFTNGSQLDDADAAYFANKYKGYCYSCRGVEVIKTVYIPFPFILFSRREW